MNTKINSSNGFANMAVVAAIVVAAIAGTGYFVFAKNDSGGSKKSTSSSNSISSSKNAEQQAVKSAASAHFALVYENKLEAAYQATCPEFRDLTPYSKFQSYLDNPGFKTIDLSLVGYTSNDIRNNQAVISGPVGPLDPDSDLEVSLLKKNEQWCVYGYKIKKATS